MSCFKSLLPKYLYDIELGQDHEDLQGCEEVPEGGQRDSVNCNYTCVNWNNQVFSVILYVQRHSWYIPSRCPCRMVPMSMTETFVLFILVEAPPFDNLWTKNPVQQHHQGWLLWRYSLWLSLEATSLLSLDLVSLLQLKMDAMLLLLGKLVWW